MKTRAASVLNIGETIDHFKIVDFLGAGGMGEVYQALDLRLERMVAIKVLDPKADQEWIERFKREGKAAAALQHPNIVTVYEVGEHAHVAGMLHYLVMELIEGRSLRYALDGQPTTARTLEWIRQIAEGLAAAHRAKVVHRDLKPENIMITATGSAKIVDFGIAKTEARRDLPGVGLATNLVTGRDEILGTFHYMSPEQATGGTIDYRSDIFSLGTILYEATERRLPFSGARAEDVLREIAEREPEIASTGPVREIIARCLAKAPQARYQDAAEIADAIATILHAPVTINTVRVGVRQPIRSQVRIAAAAVVIAVGIGALWVWDYYRLKVQYYAAISTRWGAPLGVGPLNGQSRRAREMSYRFEIREKRVRRVVRVNSAGQMIDTEEDEQPTIQVVSYREDGTVQQIDHRDRNGKLMMRKTFSAPSNSEEGVVQYVDFHVEHHDEPLALSGGAGLGVMNLVAASEITAHQLLYDSSGRTSRILYLNAYRQSRPNAAGMFGERLIYQGSSLLPSGIESIDPKGTPMPGSNGRVRVDFARNIRGEILEFRNTGVDGQPVLEHGCSRVSRTLDVHGNMREFACFGVDNEPALYSHGFHRSTQTFDGRGNMIEWAHFGLDGRPVLDADGVHKCKRRFNEQGRPIEWAFFGVDGRPVLNNEGYHKGTEFIDGRGNVLERSFFGVDAKPILDIHNVHRIKFSHDSRGNVIEQAFFGIDGKPTSSRDGIYMIRSRFDPRDRLTRQAFFSVDGKPVMSQVSYHRVELTYDDRGNVIGETYFGIDDQPVIQDGFHRIARTFDTGGNLSDVAYYGTDGKPTMPDGYHRFTRTYDHRRNREEYALYGVDGNPVLGGLSFHKEIVLYDSRGNELEEAFYGLDGGPCTNSDGYHKRTFTVDAVGNTVETAYFAVNGSPAVNPDGVHRIESHYDIRRHLTDEAYFGTDGRSAVDREGIHRITRYIDSRGELMEVAKFGLNEEPKSGASWIVFAWRAMANHEASFTQKFTPVGLKRPEIERGVVVFGELSRMRWTYEIPESKLFVVCSDGRSWFYVKNEGTVTVTRITETTKETLPWMFLSNPVQLHANFIITDERSGSIETTHLKARHSNAGISQFSVERDVRDGLIRHIDYTDRAGNRMVFELSELKPIAAAPELFEFKPPPGVQVMEME